MNNVQQKLLNAALSHVPSNGWTLSAIQAAAKELNLSPAVATIFAKPEGELVHYFVDHCNKSAISEVSKHSNTLDSLSLNQRIKWALQSRLQMHVPYLNTWPQAMAILAHPYHLPRSIQLLNELTDGVLHSCGDVSTDVDWYAKRAALAAAYTATELYMLADFSPNHADTWDSLERRLEEIDWVLKGKLPIGGQNRWWAGH